MDRSSPMSNAESLVASSPPSSPGPEDGNNLDHPANAHHANPPSAVADAAAEAARKKKASRKKRKVAVTAPEDEGDLDAPIRKPKKPKQRRKVSYAALKRSIGPGGSRRFVSE